MVYYFYGASASFLHAVTINYDGKERPAHYLKYLHLCSKEEKKSARI